MIQNLKIGTWNIENNWLNTSKKDGKTEAIIDFILKEKFDVLNLQDVNIYLAQALGKELCSLDTDCQIVSKYGYHINPIRNFGAQYNLIISSLKPIDMSSYQNLPFLPSGIDILKPWNYHIRNVTSQMLKPALFVYNTHLDSNSDLLRKKQLKKVIQDMQSLGIIEFIKENTILTGTMNIESNTVYMDEFVSILNEMQLKIAENNQTKQIFNDNKIVDYIVVPQSWDVEDVKIVEAYQNISSHLPVVAKVIRK